MAAPLLFGSLQVMVTSVYSQEKRLYIFTLCKLYSPFCSGVKLRLRPVEKPVHNVENLFPTRFFPVWKKSVDNVNNSL